MTSSYPNKNPSFTGSQRSKSPSLIRKGNQLVRVAIGTISAGSGALAVHPIDTVKVRMQLQGSQQ